MPNGFYGSRERWLEMTKPLRGIDDLLADFAERHGMRIIKDYHNWPSRTLEWGAPVIRHLAVFLAEEHQMLFDVVGVAWEDRGRERYWRRSVLRSGVPAEQLRRVVLPLLENGREGVSSWRSDDLEYATELDELPDALNAGNWSDGS